MEGGQSDIIAVQEIFGRGMLHVIIYKSPSDVLISLILSSFKMGIKQSESTQVSRTEFQPHVWKGLLDITPFMIFYKAGFILGH
jgi:hypothetical protein